MMRFAFFLGLSLAPLGCSPHVACGVDCIVQDMSITSSASNLVSAEDSCGQTATCFGASPCAGLELPPPQQGGSCDVTIQLADGSTVTTTADWGAPHDTACCGPQFANTPQLALTSDAGAD